MNSLLLLQKEISFSEKYSDTFFDTGKKESTVEGQS